MAWLVVSLVRAASISVAAGLGYWFAVRGYVALSVISFLFAILFYIFSTNNPATLYRRLFSGCVLAIIGMLAMSVSGYVTFNFGSSEAVNQGNVKFEIYPIEWWVLFGLIVLAAICGSMDWITNKRERLADERREFEVMIDSIKIGRTSADNAYRATGRGTMVNSSTVPIHITAVEFKRRWFYKLASGRLFYVEGAVNMPPRDGIFIIPPQSDQVTSFVIDIEFQDPLRDMFLSLPCFVWLDDMFNSRGLLVVRADANRHSSKSMVRLTSGP